MKQTLRNGMLLYVKHDLKILSDLLLTILAQRLQSAVRTTHYPLCRSAGVDHFSAAYRFL